MNLRKRPLTLYLGALFRDWAGPFWITILVNLLAQVLLRTIATTSSNTGGAIVMRSKRTDNHTWRKIKSALASTTAFVSAILVILPLGLVFFHLLINGITSVNWIFFTKLPAPVGEVGGGMANAIVGSLELLPLLA